MTISDIQDQIIADFSRLPEWLDKFEYLIQLANTLEAMPGNLKTEKNQIPGCQSKVWISARLENGHIRFLADSDAQFTRGLIALLVKVMDNQSPMDILKADLTFIDQIGLRSHLSPVRAHGLQSIIKQMKHLAVIP